ncbi:MAG: barstar family protein [Pseudomonadota bacterium]
METLQHIIGDEKASGVYRLEAGVSEPEIRRLAEECGLTFVDLDGADMNSKDLLLTGMAEALQFPEYFGHNWDALEDCLTDMSSKGKIGYVINYHDSGVLARRSEEDFRTLVEILDSTARYWAEQGKRFIVLLSGSMHEAVDAPLVR